jgi:DnaJ-class molecular chaperone
MKNYYELLSLPPNATVNDIYNSYQHNITQFNNLSFLTKTDIAQIKELKKALFILSNNNLRNLYNNKLNKLDTLPVNDEDVQCANTFDNFDNEDVLDTQFNTIMSEPTQKRLEASSDSKKNKLDSSVLGSRIFSLSYMNKPPELNEFNLKLRKPENGRIEKND